MPQNKAASGGQHRLATTCWPFTTQRIPHAPTPAAQRSPAETHTAHPPGDAQAHAECIFIQRAQRSEVREKPCNQKRGNRALPRLAAWRSVPQAQTRPAGQSRVIGSRTPGWSHKNGGSSVINAPPDAGASPARPRRQAGGHHRSGGVEGNAESRCCKHATWAEKLHVVGKPANRAGAEPGNRLAIHGDSQAVNASRGSGIGNADAQPIAGDWQCVTELESSPARFCDGASPSPQRNGVIRVGHHQYRSLCRRGSPRLSGKRLGHPGWCRCKP